METHLRIGGRYPMLNDHAKRKRAQGELTSLGINLNARVRLTSDEMPDLAMLVWTWLRRTCSLAGLRIVRADTAYAGRLVAQA